MHLHSGFHDYYHHAIGYGVDEKVHYNRFTKVVNIALRTKNDWLIHQHGFDVKHSFRNRNKRTDRP
jgi:hypothetical protein